MLVKSFNHYLQTARSSGWGRGGVYNGFVVSCFGILVYRGVYFGLYDTSLEYIVQSSIILKLSIGYSVTVLAEFVAYPLDTVRRRMMMTSGRQAGLLGSVFCHFLRSAI